MLMQDRCTSLDGRKVVRSFSMQQGLISKVDAVAARIKRSTGMHVDRSKIFSALCELLVDAQANIVPYAIEDARSLREQIAAAIAANRPVGAIPRSRARKLGRGALTRR
jgi:Mg2+ and Co2+ transporter CorA